MTKKIASPNFEPRLVTSNKTAARQRINADAGSGGVNFTVPQNWRPEFADESRVFYPIDRLQANRHNQLYYKVDGTIGTVIDMYAEIIGSQFHLSGEGVEGEVKDAFELSLEKTMAIAAFPMFIKYYLVFGECIPHLTFDKDKKIWTSLMFHNPDQISVTKCDLLNIPDIIEFTPDETLRKLARSNHPVIQTAMSTLPPEVLAALISGQGIPLDTNTNVTFMARKQFAHETRGTSILSRLYRILMIEDAIAQCFVKGTPVTLHNSLHKAIEDVKIGDRVLDKNGDIQTVEAAWEEGIPEELISIELFGGYKFECTKNHRWPVFAYPKTCLCGCEQIVSARKSYISKHGTRKLTDKWSDGYSECSHCRSTKFKHNAKGLCVSCYSSWSKGKLDYSEAELLSYRKSENEISNISWESYGKSNTQRWSNKRLPTTYNPFMELRADELKKFDCLLIPRKFEVIPDCKITKDQARLLGYYVAEGSKVKLPHDKRGINFTFNINEKNTWVVDIENICLGLGVQTWKADRVKENACTVGFCRQQDSELAYWILKNGGEYSKTKVLSDEVMRWPLELKAELIKGYFRGDGSHSGKQIKVFCATVSFNLAMQLRTILHQLGYFSGYQVVTKNLNGKKYVDYRLNICNPFATELIKLIWGISVPAKKSKREMSGWKDDDYIYVPIKNVTKIKSDKKVYNLTVSGSHSYLVNGVATFNCTIQTARRHASPLKIAKVGMMLPDGNPWMPEVGFEDKLIQLLAAAETDPHSFLLIPWHVQFEAFGTTDRALSLRNEYETIEKIKLVGLGVSSEFLHGTATYNSMKGQLQVLMMRMSNLRNYFEHMWWIPKFFRPMSELNEFIKPTDAEVNHRVKFRRSKKELLEDNRYIIPTMNWTRQLDPKVDDALLDTYEQIVVRLGEKVSRATILSAANLDREVEDKNLKEEKIAAAPTKEKKPSGGGGGELSFPEESTETPEGEAPVEEAPEGETIELEVPGASKQSKKIPAYQEDLETFIDFVQTKKPTKFWARILNKDEKPEDFIKKLDMERVVDFLDGTGYNYKEIEGFKRDLANEVEIPIEVKEDVVASLINSLDATGSGKDIDNTIDTFIRTEGKDLGLESLIGKGRLRELDLVKG